MQEKYFETLGKHTKKDTMLNKSNLTLATTVKGCQLNGVALSMAVVILTSGILLNAFVISFLRRERRSKKTVSILLLFHMSLNNILALSTSLPLHVILNDLVPRDLLPVQLANVLCALRPISQFIFLKVGLLMLTGICVDRYEIFTRMSEPRILTRPRAKKLVIASWVISITTSLLASYGFIENALRNEVYCEMSQHFAEARESEHKTVSNILVIVDVSMWITACNAIDVYTLWAVGKMLLLHIESVRSTLGAQETLQEIKVVKLAAYVWIAYALIWMPYGVARGLFFSKKEPRSATIRCLYIISQTFSYAIFAAIPFVYIATNRRMLRGAVQNIRTITRIIFRRKTKIMTTEMTEIALNSNTGETNVSFQT